MADQENTPFTDALKPLLAQLEKAREQGRLEILREIAKFDEHGGMDHHCPCCNTYTVVTDHQPDCLWLRAKSAVESAQAKS